MGAFRPSIGGGSGQFLLLLGGKMFLEALMELGDFPAPRVACFPDPAGGFGDFPPDGPLLLRGEIAN